MLPLRPEMSLKTVSLFSQLKLSAEALEKINDWKNKDWEKYITIAAQMAGIEEWLNVLSNHPSVAGVVFSIFTQFSGNRYKFGAKGFIAEKAPDYYAIGRNTTEKLAYGFLYWVFNHPST